MTATPNPFEQTAVSGGPWTSSEQRSEVVAAANVGKIHVIPVPDGPARAAFSEVLYRGFEVAVALVGLIVALPLILLGFALVWFDSPGPVLFPARRAARSAQVRGGDLVGRTDLIPPPGGYDAQALYCVPVYFTLYKLRTMYVDARKRFPELYAYKYSVESFQSGCFKVKDDPRVTRAGKWLRRASIDELPNLWSVVIGDMRLVGPRPEIAEVIQYYTPEQMLKFTVKPGITGLAQIGGRGLLTWGETLALDVQYVKTRTIALDLKIIFLTIVRVLTSHGAF